VTKGCKRTGCPVEVTGTQVIQSEALFIQVTGGELFLDPLLSLASSDELIAADPDYIHTNTVECEMEYESDYGND